MPKRRAKARTPEARIQVVLTLHSRAGLQVAVYPDMGEAKADVVRLVRERGGDDALRTLAVYNDGRMYEWTGWQDRGHQDQYTIHLTPVPVGELAAVYYARGCNARRRKELELRRG